MASLVSNGNYLFRFGSALLRTPLSVILQPDEKKIYQIGDEQTRGADGYLHGGFRGSTTDPSVVRSVGYQLVNQMINGSPVWLDASGPHDPEFVWYHGAYSTSAADISYGENMSEAYAALAGFHFTIPNSLVGRVTGAKVRFLNMGACVAYGAATDRSARNNNWNLDTFTGPVDGPFTVPFHFLPTPTCNYHQLVISTYPYDEVDISTGYGSLGDFRGVRDLWELDDSASTDGCIPTLTTPVVQTYNMGSTTFNLLTNNGGGWIVPSIWCHMTSTSDYGPSAGLLPDSASYEQKQINYWACVSLRQIVMELLVGG